MEDLKLFIAWALSPLILAFFLFGGGWFLWFARKGKWRGGAPWCFGAACLLLLIGSLPVLSYERNRAREYEHGPLDLSVGLDSARPVAIVVLGTGFNPDPWLPPNSQVSSGQHARFLEGVRVFRSRPAGEARLLVSVANDEAPREDKEAFLAAMLELVGIDPANVDLITEARSTDDEAEMAADRVPEGAQVVIATSASHMPRAMTIFEDAGLEPIPAPCEWWFPREGSPHEKKWKRWIPSAGGIGGTRAMLYEGVASLWHGISGE